jgi:hypothetical protein
VPPDELILHWTEALTGLEPARVRQARERIASWDLPHVGKELSAATVDAAAAATLLVEGIERLQERGVQHAQIRKKLRRDWELWPSWAEIRAADILLRFMGDDVELRLEEGKSKGAHADLRFLFPAAADGASVEVKAVGLSDDERNFCRRMAPALPALLPPRGLSHGHAAVESSSPPKLTREQRREGARQARRALKQVPNYPDGLRGAVIVGHGSEGQYARRVGRRVLQAVRQLSEHDECWIAIHWSNGAPIELVHRSVPWSEIPENVVGLFILGSGVAFPDAQIHNFASQIHRSSTESDSTVHSLEEGQDELATLVLDRFERSSGVRATLLEGWNHTIVTRDGEKRILPFNLLMDVDPPGVDRAATNPPWASGPGTPRHS